jgi:segregation and condensation protein B
MSVSQAFRRLAAEMEAMPAQSDREERLSRASRIVEALLFAAKEPLSEDEIARVLPDGIVARDVLDQLRAAYAGRGVELSRVSGKWMFRTAPDLGYLLSEQADEPKKLTRAGLETLAIIAYHQPVTRAEIEDIRGVATHRGTLDLLLETGWVRMRGRRRTPGRPITYGTTEAFLVHFNLDRLSDLPGLDELKGAGLMDGTPAGFTVPLPNDDPALRDDEDALEPDLFEEMAEERLEQTEAPLDPEDETAHR